jgi:hypothetical protein
MKWIPIFAAALAILVSRGLCQTASPADTGQPDAAAREVVYIVARPGNAEARALLSARLMKLNAANPHWYDGENILRIELPKGALTAARADPDVTLALPELETDKAKPEISAATPPVLPAGPPQAAPAPPAGMPSSMGLGQGIPPPVGVGIPTPIGVPQGMGMGMNTGTGMTGILDSFAGLIFTRLFNPPASCRISVAAPSATFGTSGGEQVVVVIAHGPCAWQAYSSVPWITVTSGSGVSGSGIVSYSVSRTEGKQRTGSILIAATAGGSPIKGNATVVVTQHAGAPGRQSAAQEME